MSFTWSTTSWGVLEFFEARLTSSIGNGSRRKALGNGTDVSPQLPELLKAATPKILGITEPFPMSQYSSDLAAQNKSNGQNSACLYTGPREKNPIQRERPNNAILQKDTASRYGSHNTFCSTCLASSRVRDGMPDFPAPPPLLSLPKFFFFTAKKRGGVLFFVK